MPAAFLLLASMFTTSFQAESVSIANAISSVCDQCKMLQTIWLLEDYKEPEGPEVDWSKVKVDTPILIRDYEGQEWARRYFAKYENETIYAWDGGRTSWTGDGVTEWKYAKLAESEE